MRRFRLTEAHLKLLRRVNVNWCGDEFGAPCIDPKRPYGNSDAIRDIHEILGGSREDGEKWNEEGWPEYVQFRYESLHKATEIALQIVLATRSFVAGNYEADDYVDNWRLIGS